MPLKNGGNDDASTIIVTIFISIIVGIVGTRQLLLVLLVLKPDKLWCAVEKWWQ